MPRCWLGNHDWYVLDVFTYFWTGDWHTSDYKLKVCLKCEKVVDEISPVKQRIEELRQERVSRAEKARAIYEQRKETTNG